MLEGDWADDLPVSWLVHGQPWWISSHVCCKRLVFTGLSYPSREILAACVTEVLQRAASRAGSLRRSKLAELQLDARHGQKMCATMMICADCWYSTSRTLPGSSSGSGGNLNLIDNIPNIRFVNTYLKGIID